MKISNDDRHFLIWFKSYYLLIMGSSFFIYLLITVLYFTIGVKDLSKSDYLGVISFIFFWNGFFMIFFGSIIFNSITSGFKKNNIEQIKKYINTLPRFSFFLLFFIGFTYCSIITISGMKAEAESYKSILRILDFTLSIVYSYIIIPVYFTAIFLDNLMIKVKEKIFILKGIVFEPSKKKFINELLVAFIIISLYPIITIILSIVSNNLLQTIININPYLVSYFIIIIIGIFFIVLFKAYSFSLPVKNLISFVNLIKNGTFSARLPVTIDNELGTLIANINSMAMGLEERERIKDIFGKMVDPVIRDHLLNGNIKLGGTLTEGTILFSDIRDFTTISETMAPEKVVELLNRYFDIMSQSISENSGLVNKYIGDAIMAIFGVLNESDEQADHAILSAIQMQKTLKKLNTLFVNEGLPEIKNGIGIHKGKVLAGNIGSATRMEFTVIGDTVNVASRIEGLTKLYASGIVVSQDVLSGIVNPQQFNYRFLMKVRVKGRKTPVLLYEILDGLEEHDKNIKIATKSLFEEAVTLYYNRRIAEALSIFNQLLKQLPDDKIVVHYAKRCAEHSGVIIPDQWDGIENG
ncbi:MAG: hypothetical protein A2015_06440 [Spirochaetes bacterium GWF1_31_7]|nr:MAG: hypothetical protein A2Y30_08275 [Spirochaetes bacterium GWE1_32_154]OHD51383.1 MAG: hypothetical protein A2Y29_14660 [Spirochaetes bacterium GWE2_31_10]OHD53109.1 MAG: hypothetical protein A2015_06440 [Spirochaetes bacterium GWF1_31_7]HBD94470.1 hypothetical protein [Spirochaetia bacterium]HBI36115.1 hypothetical protein [Spirochaetia bacterium]